MNHFEVWAPSVPSVSIRIQGADIPMQPRGDGYWEATVESAGHGTQYQFVLHSGAYPDPRSNWQPLGIDGPSALVDHSTFDWSDARWHPPSFKSAIIYELHIGTFSPEGTFDGAIAYLDYLVETGISHVELMPVNEFSGDHGWGYDGVNLFAPHHCYGGPAGLKRLVDACHSKGLAVILDVVYNHLGPLGNTLEKFAPYFTRHYSTPWGAAINLDQTGCDHVRRFICDNALMWLRDYHFDGLRLDAIHAFFDSSPRHILEQLADEVDVLEAHVGRELVLIAESDLNDPRIVTPRAAGGHGIKAQWSDDFHHSIHTVLTGENNGYYEDFGNLAHIAKSLRDVWVYDGCYSEHRGRHHGRPATGLQGWNFLAYSQNHDQIGNRAKGERLSQLLSTDKLKMAAALVFTSPYVPMIFQGEEWAAQTPFLYFTDHREEWVAMAVSEGRRREFAAFGWRAEDVPDPQDRESFLRSKLSWNELTTAAASEMLSWYRELIRFRRARPELSDGNFQKVRVHFDEQHKWLRMGRQKLQVFYNFGDDAYRLGVRQSAKIVLASRDASLEGDSLTLPPNSVTILESE